MGEQHSQKQGLKSSSQKEDRARDAYAELPEEWGIHALLCATSVFSVSLWLTIP